MTDSSLRSFRSDVRLLANSRESILLLRETLHLQFIMYRYSFGSHQIEISLVSSRISSRIGHIVWISTNTTFNVVSARLNNLNFVINK